ncbi:MAG: hypothetical protein K0R08_938, partial [Solimicrobium sp.]|nr:hypothetical protein [Solimicrobium sp.]
MESIKSRRYPSQQYKSSNTAPSQREKPFNHDMDKNSFSRNEREEQTARDQQLEGNWRKHKEERMNHSSGRDVLPTLNKTARQPTTSPTEQKRNISTSPWGKVPRTLNGSSEHDASLTLNKTELKSATAPTEQKCNVPILPWGNIPRTLPTSSKWGTNPSKQPDSDWKTQIDSLFFAQTLNDFAEKIQQASTLTKTAQHLPDEWFKDLTTYFQSLVENSPRDQLEKYWSVNIRMVLDGFRQFANKGEGINGFLSCAARLLSDEENSPLDPQAIADVLYSLHHLASCEGTDKVQLALAPHVGKVLELDPHALNEAVNSYRAENEVAREAVLKVLAFYDQKKVKPVYSYDL